MKKKKMTCVLATLSVLTLTAVSFVSSRGIKSRNANADGCAHSHVEHYKVYPTTSNGGRIEHWACCECGTAWYDEAKTRVVANRSDLDVAASSVATEISSSALDAGDLISTIYGESDKTKGLDQTNWGAEGTTCKSTGDWRFYSVDGVKALKVSATGLTDHQRQLQHECNNGGFGEFRFKTTVAQAKYVTFDYKLYDLNTEKTSIDSHDVHFVAQQYDGSNYSNCEPVDLVYDNAWHKAVVTFANPVDITYLPMKFFHFDGEFYISNLQISATEPATDVQVYDFSHSSQILDFANATNAKYSIVEDPSGNYLKVEKGLESGSTYLNLVKPVKAGQTVSFVVTYVTSNADLNSGGQFTFLGSRGNGYDAKGDTAVMGNAPWDGGWNSNAIKVSTTFTADGASAHMQFVFNNDASAYYKVSEIVIKDGAYIDFSRASDVYSIISQHVNTEIVDNSYLKVQSNGSGSKSIAFLRPIAATEKAYIKIAYVTSDANFNSGGQFTAIVSKPNNTFTGGNGGDTVMGNASWDGGWNANEIVIEFAPGETKGIYIELVFNSDPNAYFKVLGIAVGDKTSVNLNNPGDAILFGNANNVSTSYCKAEEALKVEQPASGTRSLTFYNNITAGQTVALSVEYVTDDPVFQNGVNQFTVLLYQANKNGEQISSTCVVMGSAPWDGGWDSSSTTLNLTTTENCAGVWIQFVFNNVPNSYFLVHSVTIA